jgi:hypothetical protein
MTRTPTPGPLSADDVALLPCPFCEGDLIVTDSQECQDADTYYWHRCAGCGVESEGAHGASAARDQWNMRSQPFGLAPTAPVETLGPAAAFAADVVRGEQRLPNENDRLRRALYRLFEAHGAKPDVLSVIGSLWDTIDQSECTDLIEDWLTTGKTIQRQGDVEEMLSALEEAGPPTTQPDTGGAAPGHTDLMVSPESIDAFLEANPLPDDTGGAVEASGAERERLIEAMRDHIQLGEVGSCSAEIVGYEEAADAILSALRPQPTAPVGEGEEPAGCAEPEVGRAVYERIEKLIDAKPGTPEGDELSFLAFLVESVEEVGGYDGPLTTPVPAGEGLTVWYGSMPESNGRQNWTAILGRKGDTDFDIAVDGFCFARSEYPDRVRYDADHMRWVIGELAEKPCVLDYDEKAHSGYVASATTPAPALSVDLGEVKAALEPFAERAEGYEDMYDDGDYPDWSPFIPMSAYRVAREAIAQIERLGGGV